MRLRWRLLLLTLLGLVTSNGAAAGEEPTTPDVRRWLDAAGVSGSLRGGYWSSNRKLDDRTDFVTSSVWLRVASTLREGTTLRADGWVGTEDLTGGRGVEGRLREATLQQVFGPFDVRVGKQIVAWGRADRINPTDNINPKDYTLLVIDDEDQREGSVAVRGTYHWRSLSLTALWLPFFRPDEVPLPRPPAGVSLRQRVPHHTFGQFAAKIDHTGGGIDWSLSYYDGFDPYPDLGIDRLTPQGLDVLLHYHAIRVLGADAAATVGPYGLRGEVAYTFTENSQGRQFDVKRPFLFLVLGGDRTLPYEINVNAQYLFRWISHFRSPRSIADPIERAVAFDHVTLTTQLDEIQHGFSLRILRKWLQDTLDTELAAVGGFTRGDFLIRPKITYAISDRWKAFVGADVFTGPSRSFLGRLENNTTAYAELRLVF